MRQYVSQVTKTCEAYQERCLSSPPHNVSKLLAEHGRQLHALLFRLTLRSDVAEDLLQDLFCKLAAATDFAVPISQPLLPFERR